MENRKSVIKIISLLTFLIATLAIISCSQGSQWIYFHDKEIRGSVVDADTKKPIDGVLVVSMWRLSQIGSQGFGGYAKVIEVKTDKDGHFTIPAWNTFKPLTFNCVMHALAPEIIIYKPGFKVYSSHKLMREGFPDDYSMTADEKKKIKEANSINPAKLHRVESDKDILKNYRVWETIARFPDRHFSKEQSREIFNALEEDLLRLSEESVKKHYILQGIKSLRKSWRGDEK